MLSRKASLLASVSVFIAGLALGGQAIPNWFAPATWSPAKSRGGLSAMDTSSPLPFLAVTPCRVADTRGNGFTGAYGPPSLAANGTRTFTIRGQCGIPASAAAVSFNFAALNVSAAGDLRVFPAGGTAPLVSTLNYNGNTPNIANAAVVVLGAGGAITVQADAVSIDLIIDVNGYYADLSIGAPLPSGYSFDIVGNCLGGVIYGANTFAYGVQGEALAPTGALYGVFGHSVSQSADAAGVYGRDGTGVFRPVNAYDSAGVRGESGTHSGVLGFSRYIGVTGSVINTSGTEQAFGILGFNNGSIYAVYAGGNYGGSGAVSFVEPHPADASQVIRYVSLEGPEAGTYFRGRGRFQNGLATIDVPEDFRMVTDPEGLSIQVTPIGELATVAVLKIGLDGILVKASRNVEFFFTVNGVRKTHRDLKPIGPGNEYMPRSADARIPAYLTEGQKAMLISNGTYNADGTVNLETAQRLGWAKAWQERKE